MVGSSHEGLHRVFQKDPALRTRACRAEFPHLKSRMPTLPSSYFAALVGAVSAQTVQRYVDTQWERPWQKRDGS